MNLINKSELKYVYNWRPIPNDDSRISGAPDSTLFNKNEGYEVLYLINKFAEIHSINEKETLYKIEKLIRIVLPGNLRNQLHVLEWLEITFREGIQ